MWQAEAAVWGDETREWAEAAFGAGAEAWEVDTRAGAAYIHRSRQPVTRTVEVGPAVNVDYDADGGVVGIEVLDLDLLRERP